MQSKSQNHMGKRLWMGTGWKMNHLLADAAAYADRLKRFSDTNPSETEIVILPPFTALAQVCASLTDTNVIVGGQNVSFAEKGAWTGEISAAMLADVGAGIVMVGHSERRANFAETDAHVNQKVLIALQHGLQLIVCIGESGEERELGADRETVVRQVKMALANVPKADVNRVVLAYEPVWAIGEGGKPASPADANRIHAAIRETVAELYDQNTADGQRIVYGGSVNPNNALAFIGEKEIDGLFIGRSAWQPSGFIGLIELVQAHIAGEQTE